MSKAQYVMLTNCLVASCLVAGIRHLFGSFKAASIWRSNGGENCEKQFVEDEAEEHASLEVMLYL